MDCLSNFQGCRVPVVSKLNIGYLRENLVGYHDKIIVDLMEFGAPISISDREVSNPRCKNHKGACTL